MANRPGAGRFLSLRFIPLQAPDWFAKSASPAHRILSRPLWPPSAPDCDRVMPGTVLTSISQGSPASSSIRSTRPQPLAPTASKAFAASCCRRCSSAAGRPQGQWLNGLNRRYIWPRSHKMCRGVSRRISGSDIAPPSRLAVYSWPVIQRSAITIGSYSAAMLPGLFQLTPAADSCHTNA